MSKKQVKLPGKISHWPISKLVPYERNPRTHSKSQIKKIVASLQEFGWTNPILVDKKAGIIAGHGRFLAALELGIETVPVIELSHLTAKQKKAYLIADNQLAIEAGWDEEMLALELGDLKVSGFDLDIIGFKPADLDKYLWQEPEEPQAPEPPDDPKTKTGDLYVLGSHRLLCGDSSLTEDVDRLLGGAQIHLVNTDPPYNVKVEPRSNNAIAAGLSSFSGPTHHQQSDIARHGISKSPRTKLRPKDRPLENDFLTASAFKDLLDLWFGNICRVLKKGRSFYIWGGYSNVFDYPETIIKAGLRFSQIIVWIKGHPVMTRKDFMGNHESCFYGWKPGCKHYFNPSAQNATDVWDIKKINPQSMIHLTEKPVELATRAMQYSSRPRENVLDLFGGSGSTLIGAEQTGRNSYLMEIDPAYCDVIVGRWEEMTKKKAKLLPNR